MRTFIIVLSSFFLMSCIADAGYYDEGYPGVIYTEEYSSPGYGEAVFFEDGMRGNDERLLTPEHQQRRYAEFQKHLFAPWDPTYVNRILQQSKPDDVKTLELNLVNQFDNHGKNSRQIGYGVNFRPYSTDWIDSLADNMQLAQLTRSSMYRADNRAITVTNLDARELPTSDPHFYYYKIPGQGYPFDNLQVSAVWAGTPIYVIGETRDHAWSLVITPSLIGWVKSDGIAHTNMAFVQTWQGRARKNLAAITQTNTSIIDHEGHYRFSAYLGAVFPAERMADRRHIRVLIPIIDKQHNAAIASASLSTHKAALMPLPATPQHMTMIMKQLLGRPYGWGGMYSYNDCSQELISLYAPFGIWLPRHSSDQVNAGHSVDLSNASVDERLQYLAAKGHPFMTIVYVGGHVFLYVGNSPNPRSAQHELVPLTFQNVWAFDREDRPGRIVVGKSILLPLLKSYPEDRRIVSQATKRYYQVSFLDEFPQHNARINVTNLLSS